jgi:hypothetical protein
MVGTGYPRRWSSSTIGPAFPASASEISAPALSVTRILPGARFPQARPAVSGVPLTGCGTPLGTAGVCGASAAPRARPEALRSDPPQP